jgi:two-component system, OmpR family, sensor histidine kinase VicK
MKLLPKNKDSIKSKNNLYIYGYINRCSSFMVDKKERRENEEITEILYGNENTISRGIQFMQNACKHIDLFGERNGPSIIIEFPNIYKNNYIAAKNRGVKIRFITEITKDNIHYCKQVRDIVTEMRHLEGLIGGIAVTEKEYMTTTSLKNKELLTQVFYSNAYEVVKQGQYIFDTFWEKAIAGEQRIKEIEEGIEPVKTKVLENQEEIYNHLRFAIKSSTERYVCSSIGGMLMVYNNFFDLYKDIIERQKRNRSEGNGIKWLTFIDNNKNSIELAKAFLKEGIQVRHIKNLPSMNFSVDSKSIQATIEGMDKGKLMNNLLVSNEPAYVKHFMLFFKDLWDNQGIDALERIKDIEEGLDYDTEVIIHSDRTLDIYLEIVGFAQSEIFFIFPTPKAFILQLKAIYLAKQVSKERKAKIRILTPISELVERWIEGLLKKEEGEGEEKQDDRRSTKFMTNFFPGNDIEIRYIERMSQTKATIVVVDRKESLVMELKDDTKDTFIEAIGLCTRSTSKASVLSYVAIFENLCRQSELYQEIKETNEKLETKDKVLNEFIHIASHEIRNPIQPILSLSHLVKLELSKKIEPGIDKDKIFNFLDVIIRNAKKLNRLTDDVLDIAKIETNSLALNKEIFNLKDLIQDLIDDYKSQQKNDTCNIELNFNIDGQQQQEVDDNLFLIYADKARISQVVSNLLINALKFTNKDCLIQVTIERKVIDNIQKEVIVTIKDTGTGIDPQILPILFTKFASKSFHGTGLGLYICKNIIEAHGGKVWAKNNGDGNGATFSFSLLFDE